MFERVVPTQADPQADVLAMGVALNDSNDESSSSSYVNLYPQRVTPSARLHNTTLRRYYPLVTFTLHVIRGLHPSA